ncbi:MAG: OadG family protein [Bacteroidales bacterium]|nr:OadG family protein [Bacteroidales bacterium]MCF8328416.1 OadG family protein [Bacteroidales bacterium]
MILESISFDFSHITNSAIIIAISGYLIIFTALVLLYLVFNNIPKLIKMNLRSRRKNQKGIEETTKEEHFDTPGEVNAAIATALYMYFNELHDEESNIITMQKISKRYSPWSSKIYGLRNNPGGSRF